MVPEGRDWSYQADGDCADLKGLVHVSGIDVVEGEQLSLGSSPFLPITLQTSLPFSVFRRGPAPDEGGQGGDLTDV